LKVIFGDDAVQKGEPAYTSFVNGYWSKAQADVQPSCIFKPGKTSDVSVAVLLSRLSKCPFAVRSGGHAAFAGASSIDGGITISLEKLNQIKLSADKKTALIGAGNTWSKVYSTLQKSDVSVIGGRVSNIGVGGLTLGGMCPSFPPTQLRFVHASDRSRWHFVLLQHPWLGLR
jgi:FAD/FMN-containing dehydrogenase